MFVWLFAMAVIVFLWSCDRNPAPALIYIIAIAPRRVFLKGIISIKFRNRSFPLESSSFKALNLHYKGQARAEAQRPYGGQWHKEIKSSLFLACPGNRRKLGFLHSNRLANCPRQRHVLSFPSSNQMPSSHGSEQLRKEQKISRKNDNSEHGEGSRRWTESVWACNGTFCETQGQGR